MVLRFWTTAVGCVWGIGKRSREVISGGIRDLGMEGTRRDRESARKIFERGDRSG
jgi:hypothetical protein